MKVMSYNTQHCLVHVDENGKAKDYDDKKIDYNAFIKALKESGADFVGLQEICDATEKSDAEQYYPQTKTLAEGAGYKYYYFAEAIRFGGVNPYGNAFLSKIPVLEVKTIAIPDPITPKYDGYYETRCICKAKLENGYTIIVAHFGLNPDEQENAVKTVLENLEDNCIVMGDFNMTPDNPILKPLLDKLFDTATLASGNKLTFPSDSPNVKIDYVLTSKDVVVESAEIPNVVVSDHRPHVAIVK